MRVQARKQLTAGNAIALAAVFIAIGGTAVALPGKGTVDRNDIAKNAVKGKHVKANSLKGGDIDESTLTLTPDAGGPAGGDLAGSFPSPTIRAGAVDGTKVADESLDATDLAAGSVGASELGPLTTVSESLTVANNVESFDVALCPAGTQVISGGANRSGGAAAHISEFGISGNGWLVSIHNQSGGPVTYSIEANCLTQ